MEISSILVIGIIGVATTIATLSVLIIRKLMTDGETAMVKMSLKPEETINEFRALLIFHSIVIPALVMVTIAGFTGEKIFIDVGRTLVGVQGLGVTAVFLKWWKRF